MTEPPFDPYGTPVRPVDHPHQQPYPPHRQQPLHPLGFPGRMREVDQSAVAVVRPGAVVVAFAFWLLAALSWPLGTIAQALAGPGSLAGFGPVMTLFATTCAALGGLWGAIALLRGSYQARLVLCGGALVLGVLALAAALVAARDDAGPVTWVVIALRLVLPAVAAVFSFLPGVRHHFAGNLG
ncbi:hypothetical protein [Saccharothrix xinjiangensis]|uniref:Major facilitator superfamily (MFS) profile domain-containing protein n=1 Tax=Saccharothrix xinjiangensis TaxID=204798 RepID=A0ABV9Y6E8_9PSEU